MNKLILYPLLILFIVAGFTQLYYNSTINLSYDETQITTIYGNQTLDETTSELELQDASLTLDFDMTVGIIAIIIGATALGLIGINFIGSGLSDFSIKIIWNGIVFYGLWLVFSTLGFNFFSIIPFFGSLIWLGLTLVYSIGVFFKMGSE